MMPLCALALVEDGCTGAGLSKTAYKQLSESDSPFLCGQCRLNAQELEIKALRDLASGLSSQLSAAREELATVKAELRRFVEQPEAKVTTVYADHSGNTDEKAAAQNSSLSYSAALGVSTVPHTGVGEGKTSRRHPALTTFPDQERRFNVIMCGVTECPKGVSRADRAKHDLNEVMSLFGVLDGGVRVESVRDHFRLGEYNSQSTKPRHILVKLTRVQEVSSILSNRSNAPI